MKNSILFLLSFVSLASFSMDKYVCQEYDRESEKVLQRTIVLEQTGKTLEGEFKIPELQYEAEKTPYTLTIYKNGPVQYDSTTYKGFAYTEDVNFVFISSENKNISFQVYLDEMNEGYFNFNRMKTSYFFCN